MARTTYTSDQEKLDQLLSLIRGNPGITFDRLWDSQTVCATKEELVGCTGELRSTGKIVVMGDGKGRGYYTPDADTSQYMPPRRGTKPPKTPVVVPPAAKPTTPEPVVQTGPLSEVKPLPDAWLPHKPRNDANKPFGTLQPNTVSWALATVLYEETRDVGLSLDVIYHRAVLLNSKVARTKIAIYLNQLVSRMIAVRVGRATYKWSGNFKSVSPPRATELRGTPVAPTRHAADTTVAIASHPSLDSSGDPIGVAQAPRAESPTYMGALSDALGVRAVRATSPASGTDQDALGELIATLEESIRQQQSALATVRKLHARLSVKVDNVG